MRQFVAVHFNAGDKTSYTYHNDGEPVAVDDRVRVPGRKGGERVVTVVELVKAPPFVTKAILGREAKPIGPLL
jgi:hypothetical protein